ncbi:MAG: hypothetical protein J1F11_03815 [Oscillospiraceae bacterium]|nr:hypothetical protein [Oscillospiraceae bacterium]
MSVNEYNKQLTLKLDNLLTGTGFKRKKTGCLYRKVNRSVQYLFVHFEKDKDSDEEAYTLSCSLAFQYVRADKLTCLFRGESFNQGRLATGFMPLDEFVHDVIWEKYCPDLSMDEYAGLIAQDIISHALSFYDKFDSLEKLEAYFDLHPEEDENEEFHVVNNNARSCRPCLIAAVLFMLKRWDKLQNFVDTDKNLTADEKKRILEYVEDYRKPKPVNRVKW